MADQTTKADVPDVPAVRVLSAEFSKYTPHPRRPVFIGPAPEWEFRCTTDVDLPHGHNGIGGLLRRVPAGERFGGMWQARHYEHTEWGPGSRTREGAIQAAMPEIYAAVLANVRQFEAEDRAKESAHRITADVLARLERARAQAPTMLTILQAVYSTLDQDACTCSARSWYGTGHDTACPLAYVEQIRDVIRDAGAGGEPCPDCSGSGNVQDFPEGEHGPIGYAPCESCKGLGAVNV
jgi:hypothetical protein